MSTPEARCAQLAALATIAVATIATVSAGAETPRLGHHADTAAIAAWAREVWPDGRGLPPGGGTAAAGAPLFADQCASCHGPDGIGGTADELAGGQMPLTIDTPDKNVGTYWPYATTLFDFIRRAMPMTAPGSLRDDEVYALSAYLLWRNDIIGEHDEMNAHTLPAVVMPNRNGFIRVWP